ncbi:MAG TPA: NACHT domain-containing protein [Ktedonobacteraceae bacterium]|jgi:uncharacterized membrane protein
MAPLELPDDEGVCNRYDVAIGSAQGPVIGDNAQVQQSFHYYPPLPEGTLDAEQRTNRERMLERVRSIWITNFLSKSLRGTVAVTLGLREQPEAVAHPWAKVVQSPRLPEQAWFIEQDIARDYTAFQACGEALLILGEPGSGKTILLLEIARMLEEHATQDQRYPIPVVFNLSLWGERRQPLAHWLVEELRSRYQVPPNLAEEWVARGQIALLLDGLDEVAAPHRTACVEAINVYRQTSGLLPLVVCSRQSDYFALPTRLLLHTAVVVQPLTTAQIETALLSGGAGLQALHQTLREDRDLQMLASTPLMLYVLINAYQGVALEKIATSGSSDVRRRQIFVDYIDFTLRRRNPETRYTRKQTENWLIWLARQMKQRNLSAFYLERLQIDWLASSRRYQIYITLALGLLSFLLMLPANIVFFENISEGILVACLDAVLAIPFLWLIGGDKLHRPFALRTERRFPPVALKRWLPWLPAEGKQRNERVRSTFWVLLFAGMNGSIDGILVHHLNPFYAWDHGLFYAVFYIVFGTFELRIQATEKLAWSWTSASGSAAISCLLGGVIGLLLGLSNAFDYIPSPDAFLATFSFGLILGFAMGGVIMLMRGFSADKLDLARELHIRPNQGIRNSLSNSILLGICSGLAFGLVIFFLYTIGFHFKIGYLGLDPRFPAHSDLIYGVSDGLTVAYLYWLRNGGVACLQYLLLRICLWQTHCIPWRYAHFLDDAESRILLRKAGGGYPVYPRPFA